MFHALILMAAVVATSADTGQFVRSKNDEFVFNQYPPRALAAGEQGSVRFRAEVNANGIVMSCKVTGGSGHERLDAETCDLIVDHASFKPVLDSEGKGREASHDGIVNWRIPGAAPPAKVASVSGKSPNEVVCKRITKTGSLVSHSRLCLTRREWSQYADRNQDQYGEIQGRLGSTHGFELDIPEPGPPH